MKLEFVDAKGFVDGMGQTYKYGLGVLIDLVNIPEYVQNALDDFYGK